MSRSLRSHPQPSPGRSRCSRARGGRGTLRVEPLGRARVSSASSRTRGAVPRERPITASPSTSPDSAGGDAERDPQGGSDGDPKGEYPEPRPLLALGLILLASLSFASLSASIKAIAPEVGLAPPIFARGLTGLLLCVVWLRVRRGRLRPTNWTMLSVRCLAGGAAMLCYYWALTPGGGTDLPTAVMLLKTAPLWVALLAPLVVQERPSRRIWIALAVGLAGLALRYGTSLEGERLGVLAALAAGLLSAFAYLSLRALARSDDALTVVTVFSLFLTLAPLPFLGGVIEASAGWSARSWLLLGLIGLLGTGGQLFLTSAYRYGSASAVTIAGLSEVAMATGFSLFAFREVPPLAAIVGGLMALGAGILASAGRRRAAASPPEGPALP